ncbi:MAG TPA: hypothetical protein VJB94_01915 [Candidatus Nanoarchaeia archaeon]|nr:hypothetical protein [Candidatus Nanoarchaeia archaeon]
MNIFLIKNIELKIERRFIKKIEGLEGGRALYLPTDPSEKPQLYKFSRHDYSHTVSEIRVNDIAILKGLEDLLKGEKKLKQKEGKPRKPVSYSYFYTTEEGLFPLNEETMFKDINEIDEVDRALTYALLRNDASVVSASKAKEIISKHRLCYRILEYFGKKYNLNERVNVIARRCSGITTPDAQKEPLGFGIFCIVNQQLYNKCPYMGKLVHEIEFKGNEELETILLNMRKNYLEFFIDKRQ